MIKLVDGRDASFEIVGFENIKYYLGDEYAECENAFELSKKLEAENDGMDFYHIVEE